MNVFLVRSFHSVYRNMKKISFDNLALRTLPIDTNEDSSVRSVVGYIFAGVRPTPVKDPNVVAVSTKALSLIGVSKEDFSDEDIALYFSGNKLLQGSETAAHCYCGHQFGNFAGQLGDGAAIYLGEVVNEESERWEIQLKGAGLTPFSRSADGRKVLRSSIREFLCSEAMHSLGIPTTRAGTCVTSSSYVVRDMFYDGRNREERSTIVSRIAPTFIRFGSFEIFLPLNPATGRAGPSVGKVDLLHRLLDYVIRNFYGDIWRQFVPSDAEASECLPDDERKQLFLSFYKEVVIRTAMLVARWQSVGFCHGVLNTDNMSIVGVTLDYGPFGFMENFSSGWLCNASDSGRYNYGAQPDICKWNLLKLAEAIKRALDLDLSVPVLNEIYSQTFDETYLTLMRLKLGLRAQDNGSKDLAMVKDLFRVMEETGADFTNTFRCMSKLVLPLDMSKVTRQSLFDGSTDASGSDVDETFILEWCGDALKYILTQCASLEQQIELLTPNTSSELQVYSLMLRSMPELARRFPDLQKCWEEDQRRKDSISRLESMTEEEKRHRDKITWVGWFTTYYARLCDDFIDFSCTTKAMEESVRDAYNKHRTDSMNKTNPRFVLRNSIAQLAISAAEEGDFSIVQKVLLLLEDPFTDKSASDLQEMLNVVESEMFSHERMQTDPSVNQSHPHTTVTHSSYAPLLSVLHGNLPFPTCQLKVS